MERLMTLEELSSFSILFFDRDFRYLAIYGRAVCRAGHDPQDLVGQIAPAVLEPERWAKLAPHYSRALAGDTFTVDLGDKDVGIFETVFAPFILGGMAMTRDVTEERARGLGQCPLARAQVALNEITTSKQLPMASRCAAELLSETIGAALDQPAQPLRLVR